MLIRRSRRNCGYLDHMKDQALSPHTLVYEAVDAGQRVGCIRIDDAGEAVTPFWVWIDHARRRAGLGTQLYAAAARGACRRFGKPLASDIKLSPQARGFWNKQLKKGRAECEIRDRRGRCTAFRLRCPAPDSLAAAPQAEARIQAEERELAPRGTERGTLFDPDGRVVWRVVGKSPTRLKLLKEHTDSFPGRIFTHNHPPTKFKYRRGGADHSFRSGASLSPQDVAVAAQHNAAEVRVVTRILVDGRERTIVYRMQRPPTGWPEPWRIKDMAEAKMAGARAELQREIRSGVINHEKWTSAADTAWRELAPKLGMRYDSVTLDGAGRRMKRGQR